LSTHDDESERARAIRNLRARKQARLRKDRAKARREAAVQSEKALFISVAEFAELSGLHPATIWRRIKDGTLKAKKLVGKGNKHGRVPCFSLSAQKALDDGQVIPF
jgi:hypothetical protein